MAKMMRSFRSRVIMLFGLSMLLSAGITFTFYKVLQYYYRENAKVGDPSDYLRKFIATVGDINVFMLIFFPLAFILFFILTKPYLAYFKVISEGIHHLANGNFKNRIYISSYDEFGEIAEDINLASLKLQKALERGDFAENSKDQLVVNLAHDLRTPLTSIVGYLDLILQDDQLSEEQKQHYTNIAYIKSKRLEKLIDELFEITKVNYGKQKLHKTPIDISQLLLQVNEELYPIIEINNLTSRLDIDPHLNTTGDGELLARVFENLMNNAVRYGNEGLYIDVSGKLEGEMVVVQVTNYGNPISQDDLPYIFDMFYTSDQARTHQEGSTGLGLFIAKNIIDQHGGTITAESSLVCTTFEVRLPVISDSIKDS
jgi:two-component system, OmpR family, sensor histidine kinase VanS